MSHSPPAAPDRIAVKHQPVDHQGKIGIGNRPLPEQIIAAVGQQFRRGFE
jgi:hypothetical protein